MTEYKYHFSAALKTDILSFVKNNTERKGPEKEAYLKKIKGLLDLGDSSITTLLNTAETEEAETLYFRCLHEEPNTTLNTTLIEEK